MLNSLRVISVISNIITFQVRASPSYKQEFVCEVDRSAFLWITLADVGSVALITLLRHQLFIVLLITRPIEIVLWHWFKKKQRIWQKRKKIQRMCPSQ